MIKRGPVDVLAFALGAPRFDGSIMKELERQTAAGTIRVLDAMVLFKTADDECYRVDVEDLAPEDRLRRPGQVLRCVDGAGGGNVTLEAGARTASIEVRARSHWYPSLCLSGKY